MSIQIVHYKVKYHHKWECFPTLCCARKRYTELVSRKDVTIGDIRDAISRVDVSSRDELISQLNTLFEK